MPDANDDPRKKTITLDAHWEVVTPDPKPRPLVLVAAVGESPAVVTETLWSLFNQQPSEQPERIVVFTTTAGRRAMRGKYDAVTGDHPEHRRQPLLALSSRHKAWEDDDMILALCRLCEEWRRPVPVVDIWVPRREDNREIDDIRTEADDRAFGNLVFREIRKLTEEGCPAVHASIAGGRKTMGTRLASVLSMFGRPQDELSHVLVTNPEYEGKGYWCPSKHPAEVYVEPPGRPRKKQQVADPSIVQLVRQRFWPLRGLIDEPVLNGQRIVEIEELEALVAATIQQPRILFHQDWQVTIDDPITKVPRWQIKFQPTLYAFYRTLSEACTGQISSIATNITNGHLTTADFSPITYSYKTQGQLQNEVSPADFHDAGRRVLALLQGTTHYDTVKETLWKLGSPDSIGNAYLSGNKRRIEEAFEEQLGFRRLCDHYSPKGSWDIVGHRRVPFSMGLIVDPRNIGYAP